MNTSFDNRDRLFAFGIFLVSACCLYFGWRLFWFLTDDAHISFRYISNAHLGFGYVWNAPPFRPVEGYTNFLWVVLLDIVWRFSGVEPPQSSNVISLIFSMATLAMCVAMLLKLDWPERRKPIRYSLVTLCLMLIVTNRTFLTWTSSGLETAMFNMWITLWVYIALFTQKDRFTWPLGLSAATSLIALTRPDGLLFCAVTLLLLRANKALPASSRLLAALPLLVVPMHFAWRRSFYGAWLPNTYYAKATELWPESGVRYLASFVIEYGLWFWILPGFMVLRPWIREALARAKDVSMGQLVQKHVLESPLALVVLTLAAHAAYYTLVIGGDHFEYRVYSHLVPLVAISILWMLNRLNCSNGQAVALVLVLLALSLPIPWTHWALSQANQSRKETYKMKVSVASAWPPGTRWYASVFDRLQYWLIDRHVCTRHQEHKMFFKIHSVANPTRTVGGQIRANGCPVMLAKSVGVPAWVLPHVNIIDVLGLNDFVVARGPAIRRIGHPREMAHERYAHTAYVAAFRPNVTIGEGGVVQVSERKKPLTREEIQRVELAWAKRVAGPRLGQPDAARSARGRDSPTDSGIAW